jgi:hypothetical protein
MSPFNSKMSYDEAISSTILSDVSIIADIYAIIKSAGLVASTEREVVSASRDVRVIPANTPGQNRKTAEAKQVTDKYEIAFDANDITIVGGAALNIYDFKLQALKERREIGPLEEYIKKKTSDIDIVWWPRTDTRSPIITSRSEAIIKLVLAFKAQLIEKFEAKKRELESKIRPFITNASNSDRLEIVFEMFPVYAAGVFNINVMFQMKGKTLKICDIIVHDSGSSQRYDMDGNEVTDVAFMENDPLYSFPNPGKYNSLSYLNVNSVDIAVPNIKSLIKQQLFAFENLVRARATKSFINYKRIQFIKKLLLSFKLNDPKNARNMGDLVEVFGTDQREYPEMVTTDIDGRVEESIFKLHTEIVQLCEGINTSRDLLVTELCEKARSIKAGPKINIKELERYRQREIARLGDLKESVYKNVKTSPKQFQSQFKNVHSRLDNRRIELIHMPLQELVEYKEYFETNPDRELQEIERLHEELSYQREKKGRRSLLPAPPTTDVMPVRRMEEPRRMTAPPPLPMGPPPVPRFIPLAAPPPIAVPVRFDPVSGRYFRDDRPPMMYAAPPLPPGPPPGQRYIITQYPPGAPVPYPPPGQWQPMRALPMPQQQFYGRGKTRKQTNRSGTRKRN